MIFCLWSRSNRSVLWLYRSCDRRIYSQMIVSFTGQVQVWNTLLGLSVGHFRHIIFWGCLLLFEPSQTYIAVARSIRTVRTKIEIGHLQGHACRWKHSDGRTIKCSSAIYNCSIIFSFHQCRRVFVLYYELMTSFSRLTRIRTIF